MTSKPHETGRRVIECERDALDALASSLGDAFDEAVDAILACVGDGGRVVVCGIGKSGQIGQKISSTLVSTGVHSRFLHPAEGFHGDVGMVTSADVVLAISNSGRTRELLDLLPVVRDIEAKVIAFTASPHSPLARAADLALCWGTFKEADPMELVPTTSSAVTLALGDALTVAVMEQRMARGDFDRQRYHLFHPSGAIGAKLRTRVADLLRGDHTNPRVTDRASFGAALDEISQKLLGGVSIVDQEERLVGIFTDGDVRRTIQQAGGTAEALLETPITDWMTRGPTVVHHAQLAVEALTLMENHQPRPIFLLPVVDDEGRAVGMIHLHDLVRAGLAEDASAE